MMAVRRVLTGETENGDGVFAVVEEVAPLHGNNIIYGIWGWQEPPVLPFLPAAGYTAQRLFPPPGGLEVSMMIVPGRHEAHVPDEAAVATLSRMRLAGDRFHPGEDGIHRSDTVDIGFVIAGEIVLVQGDGEEQTLRPGDCLIQSGADHRWENRTDDPCVIGMVLIGVERDARAEAPPG